VPEFNITTTRRGSKILVAVERNGARLEEWVDRPERIPGAIQRAQNDLRAAQGGKELC